MTGFASLVDFSGDAIIGATPSGTITSWNRAAVALYGYTVEEAVGSEIDMLAPEDGREEALRRLLPVRRSERNERLDVVHIAKDGTTRQVSFDDLVHPRGPNATSKWARRAGIAVSLSKPVRRERLRRCLVDLMAGSAPEDAGVTGPAAVPVQRGSRGRILLVEDSAINQVAMATLAIGGYTIDLVVSGGQPVRAVQAGSCEAVLWTVRCRRGGYETATAIRNGERTDT